MKAIPKTLAACADALADVEFKIDELKAKTKPLDEYRIALEKHLIDNLPKSQATGAAGKVARVQIVMDDIPVVKDWNVLYKYITKANAFDLLQRRLSTTAVRERWAGSVNVPGVDVFKKCSIKLTLLKSKERA